MNRLARGVVVVLVGVLLSGGCAVDGGSSSATRCDAALAEIGRVHEHYERRYKGHLSRLHVESALDAYTAAVVDCGDDPEGLRIAREGLAVMEELYELLYD